MNVNNYIVIDDEELYQIVSTQNDENAFTELYNRYKKPLIAYAVTKISEAEAEDLIQDLFIKLWHNRESLIIRDKFSSYIFKALRNRILDFMAHVAHANKYLDSLEDFSIRQFSNLADYKLREELFLFNIDRLLNKYGPKAQSIVRLRIQGYSNQEVGKMLNLSEKTVRNQYSILLKYLKNKLPILLFLIFEG